MLYKTSKSVRLHLELDVIALIRKESKLSGEKNLNNKNKIIIIFNQKGCCASAGG